VTGHETVKKSGFNDDGRASTFKEEIIVQERKKEGAPRKRVECEKKGK